MIPEDVKGILSVAACGMIGWLWTELQRLIKSHDVLAIRIEHLERDNVTHKDNHKNLYESLFAMVKELKQDISDLKETFLKNNHE